ncbi:MAG: hypothetical protein AAFQ82_21835, partial [Myxococcota bacterium]
MNPLLLCIGSSGECTKRSDLAVEPCRIWQIFSKYSLCGFIGLRIETGKQLDSATKVWWNSFKTFRDAVELDD